MELLEAISNPVQVTHPQGREHSLTPREIVRELDKYIIGQQNAKRSVAIALRNRWRRLQVGGELREEIMPNNIIMIGPTGVGKTEIARRLAKLAAAPFVKVEATKYTEVGYVGRDVESMVRDLVDQSVNIVRAEMLKTVEAKARELAEERIIEILVPLTATPKTGNEQPFGFLFNQPDLTNGNHETTPPNPEEQEKQTAAEQRTRIRFKKKLKDGELEDREIEIEVNDAPSIASMQIMGPVGGFGMDEIAQNIQDAISNMTPKKNENKTCDDRRSTNDLYSRGICKVDRSRCGDERIDQTGRTYRHYFY
ncbi:MAG TPA: AAA family ATPase [Steroidobacteraceae bacterium]|nr:AAA family ATPase [Steroidobacteraceae bacterium]